MTMTQTFRFVSLFLLLLAAPALAVDFFFQPDTSAGSFNDTITVSGSIAASDSMRGFTVYLGYDTTKIQFVSATAGTLIAGRQGLQFYYYDHIPIFPDRLDIGAAVYSTDYWAGPGELFQAKFRVVGCADLDIAAPYFPRFVAPDGSTLPWTFDPATVFACDRVPLAPSNLTITWIPADSVRLYWNSVVQDTLGRLLLDPPLYNVYRQEILPNVQPPILIAATTDTTHTELMESSEEYIFDVKCLAP